MAGLSAYENQILRAREMNTLLSATSGAPEIRPCRPNLFVDCKQGEKVAFKEKYGQRDFWGIWDGFDKFLF